MPSVEEHTGGDVASSRSGSHRRRSFFCEHRGYVASSRSRAHRRQKLGALERLGIDLG